MKTPKIKGVPELVKELRVVSNMINMGEKIRWGQETTLMDEAADKLESLHTSLVEAVEKLPPNPDNDYEAEVYRRGYNRAVDNFLTIINSIFKE